MPELKLSGKSYRESHPLFLFYAQLKKVQAGLFCLPRVWGDFTPHEYAVQFIYGIEDAFLSSNPKSKEINLQELAESIEKQALFISETNNIKFYIASIEQNKNIMMLYADVFMLVHTCVSAKDHIELENKELSQNLLYILEKTIGYLNVFLDWVRAFVYVYSIDDSGKLLPQAKVALWDLEKIKQLNV